MCISHKYLPDLLLYKFSLFCRTTVSWIKRTFFFKNELIEAGGISIFFQLKQIVNFHVKSY